MALLRPETRSRKNSERHASCRCCKSLAGKGLRSRSRISSKLSTSSLVLPPSTMTSRVWSFVGIKVTTWRESFSGRLFLVAHLALPDRIVGVVFHVFLGAYDSPCSNWLYNPLS